MVCSAAEMRPCRNPTEPAARAEVIDQPQEPEFHGENGREVGERAQW